MTEMSVSEFLKIVENSYRNRGGIDGQRSPLKTKTALTIRKRMVEDVKKKSSIASYCFRYSWQQRSRPVR